MMFWSLCHCSFGAKARDGVDTKNSCFSCFLPSSEHSESESWNVNWIAEILCLKWPSYAEMWSYAGWLFDHGWSWRKSILCWWWRANDSWGLSACPDGTFRSFLSEPAAFHRDSRHLWTLFEVEMATLTVSCCLFPRRDWLEVPFQRTSSLTSMGLSSDWPPFLNEQVVVRWAYGMASPWVVVLVFQLMAPFGLSPRRLVLYLGFRIGEKNELRFFRMQNSLYFDYR